MLRILYHFIFNFKRVKPFNIHLYSNIQISFHNYNKVYIYICNRMYLLTHINIYIYINYIYLFSQDVY